MDKILNHTNERVWKYLTYRTLDKCINHLHKSSDWRTVVSTQNGKHTSIKIII